MNDYNPYITQLILSVKTKPSIWNVRSKQYNCEEQNLKDWTNIVKELEKSGVAENITVSDAKYTWNSLLNAYNICWDDGNSANFNYFSQMRFVGRAAAWNRKGEESYFNDTSTIPATILRTQVLFSVVFTTLFLYLVYYQAGKEDVTAPAFGTKLDILSIIIQILVVFIPALFFPFNEFYLPGEIPLKWLTVVIPGVSMILEKVVSSLNLPNEKEPAYISFISIGIPVLWHLFCTALFTFIKRPFPPSKWSAFVRIVLTVGWANLIYIINNTINADWTFYISSEDVLLD